jgi:hypothetical protein
LDRLRAVKISATATYAGRRMLLQYARAFVDHGVVTVPSSAGLQVCQPAMDLHAA